MQYFIGYKEYRGEKPFNPSLLVALRKRLPEKVMDRILEKSFIEVAEEDNDSKMIKDNHSSSDSTGGTGTDPKEAPNKETLIIGATCLPEDIAYPTDLELCDKARRWTEESVTGTGNSSVL